MRPTPSKRPAERSSGPCVIRWARSTCHRSFLLQAQASGAKVIGLGSAGADTMNAVKQAQEFGIVDGGQRLVAMLMVLNDIAGMGLDAAHLPLPEPPLTLTEFDDWCTEAGLTLRQRYATWSGDAYHPGCGYAVSVHIRPTT
jgi:hypothetical protein